MTLAYLEYRVRAVLVGVGDDLVQADEGDHAALLVRLRPDGYEDLGEVLQQLGEAQVEDDQDAHVPEQGVEHVGLVDVGDQLEIIKSVEDGRMVRRKGRVCLR
jgi:hypothetical protein